MWKDWQKYNMHKLVILSNTDKEVDAIQYYLYAKTYFPQLSLKEIMDVALLSLQNMDSQ